MEKISKLTSSIPFTAKKKIIVQEQEVTNVTLLEISFRPDTNVITLTFVVGENQKMKKQIDLFDISDKDEKVATTKGQVFLNALKDLLSDSGFSVS